MPRVDHPRVKKALHIIRVQLPDSRRRRVLVVETDMPTSAEDAGFDPDEFEALVQAVQAALERTDSEEAEIVPLGYLPQRVAEQ